MIQAGVDVQEHPGNKLNCGEMLDRSQKEGTQTWFLPYAASSPVQTWSFPEHQRTGVTSHGLLV